MAFWRFAHLTSLVKRRETVSQRAGKAYHLARIPRDEYPLDRRMAYPHYKGMFVHDPLDKTSKKAHRTVYLWNTPDTSRYKKPENDIVKQSHFENKYRRLFKERDGRVYERESKYSVKNWTEPMGLASTNVRSYRKSFVPASKPVSSTPTESWVETQKRREEKLRLKYGLDDVDEENQGKRSHRHSRRRDEETPRVREDRTRIRERRTQDRDEKPLRSHRRRTEDSGQVGSLQVTKTRTRTNINVQEGKSEASTEVEVPKEISGDKLCEVEIPSVEEVHVEPITSLNVGEEVNVVEVSVE